MNKQPINRGASGETSKTKTEKQPKNLGASGETSESKFDCTNDFYKWIPESKMFDSVNFGFLKLGSLCNASENSAFTSAICNIEHIKNKTREHYSLNIQHLFSKGCGLIKDIQKEEKELDETSSAALNRLKMFFEKKEEHGRSLEKILLHKKEKKGTDRQKKPKDHPGEPQNTKNPHKKQENPPKTSGKNAKHQDDTEKENINQQILPKSKKYSEAEITVTLAEHLFKWLAPDESYSIDIHTGNQNPCACGSDICCKKIKSHFQRTGIGHSESWHGFIDIVLPPFPEKAATTEGPSKKTDDGKDKDVDDSTKNRNIIEVKRSQFNCKIVDQAIAQTIVFSFLQKKQHPNVFIPNILISPREFRVIMYDSNKDILICSKPLHLFASKPSSAAASSSEILDSTSITIIWLVLHYGFFSTNLQSYFDKRNLDMKKFQAKFHKRAKEKFDVYDKDLKVGEAKFKTHKKRLLPTSKDLEPSSSENILPSE